MEIDVVPLGVAGDEEGETTFLGEEGCACLCEGSTVKVLESEEARQIHGSPEC